MSRLRRLDVRLFVSYFVVVTVGAATLVVTFSLIAPNAFDDHMTRTGTAGGMHSVTDSHEAFLQALRTALPAAIIVSVTLSAVVAAFVARQILRPVEAVRRATARLVDGHYDQRVHEPNEIELAALAHDVNRLAAALEHTERRRGELISEVAHELRTPLTTIDGYVEGMLDGVFEPTEEVLTTILDETARLGRLASDLAALSKADEGTLVLDLERLDLAELTTRVVERLRPQFAEKQVALELQALQLLPIEGDEQRLVQVLTNLLGNALTYTSSGGHVVVQATSAGDRAIVSVADDGVGLAGAELDQVFDRFYRVPGLARPPGGSGIGLTIARSLARAHRGDIRASSEGPGRGASFELSLPIAPTTT